jgi:hypothetical protein
VEREGGKEGRRRMVMRSAMQEECWIGVVDVGVDKEKHKSGINSDNNHKQWRRNEEIEGM